MEPSHDALALLFIHSIGIAKEERQRANQVKHLCFWFWHTGGKYGWEETTD